MGCNMFVVEIFGENVHFLPMEYQWGCDISLGVFFIEIGLTKTFVKTLGDQKIRLKYRIHLWEDNNSSIKKVKCFKIQRSTYDGEKLERV